MAGISAAAVAQDMQARGMPTYMGISEFARLNGMDYAYCRMAIHASGIRCIGTGTRKKWHYIDWAEALRNYGRR
jgi:hypothetical protein